MPRGSKRREVPPPAFLVLSLPILVTTYFGAQAIWLRGGAGEEGMQGAGLPFPIHFGLGSRDGLDRGC